MDRRRSPDRIRDTNPAEEKVLSFEFNEVADIARASLMPDFFAVRIEEENLFGAMQEMISKISFPKPMAQLDAIKQLAAASPDAASFTKAITDRNLWATLRELLSKVKVS